MTPAASHTAPVPDLGALAPYTDALYRDGITGLQGAFPRDWAERMREDMMTAFWAAIQRPGGAVGRGPRRWYVEIHPQDLHGFVDLVTHPWVVGMCEAVLGPKYEIVEIGFDVPVQGARNQPWHRDFPAPPETWGEQRRLTHFDETNTYVRYPAWSPAGDRIVFERAQVTGNVWLMELK